MGLAGFDGVGEAIELWMWTEVKQYRDLEARRAEIANSLWLRGCCEALGGLGFDDHSVINEHVQTPPRNELALVVNGDHDFSVDFVSAQRELVLERASVGGPAQSSTAKVVVDGEEGGNDRVHTFSFEDLATHTPMLAASNSIRSIIRAPLGTRVCSWPARGWTRTNSRYSRTKNLDSPGGQTWRAIGTRWRE